MDVLGQLAPLCAAEPWDPVGLQIGDPSWQVRRALLAIDLTEPVLAEAIHKKVNLIVAYHPLIFDPVKAITTVDWKQRIILGAIQRKIAVYSPHTALDAASGGLNDWLADGIGPGKILSIRPQVQDANPQYKVVTFVPSDAAVELRRSMAVAGAGQIGSYSQCSFNVEGHGTFYGKPSSSPKVGARGRLESVKELRIEMVCGLAKIEAVINALRSNHPYEEPVIDLYRLELPPAIRKGGQGRIVELVRPVSVRTLCGRIKKRLGLRHLEVALPDSVKQVRRIGLCAGAGGALLEECNDIDLFLTGEMRHHDVLAATARGMAVILAGHVQTERPYLPVFCARLANKCGKSVFWSVSKADYGPSQIV